MTFWGVEVKPGEPFTLKTEDLGGLLMLTQATLGIGSSPKKSILQVKVGDKKPIFLCTLLPEKLECFLLNLEFDEDDDVTFSVEGPTSIHLSGIVEGSKHDGDDSDFDGFGEDMAETESEDSEFESEDEDDDDEDEDEDDFINDEDMPMYPPSLARKSGVVIEEIDDEEKSISEKGGNKQAKKKKEIAKPNTGNKSLEKGKTKEKNDGESPSNLKRKVDAMDQDLEPKSSNDNDAIDGDASKDKKKKNKKKKAKLDKDETVADIKQNAGEVATSKQVENKEEKKISKAVKETKQPKDKPAKVKTYSNGLVVEELETGKPSWKTASRGKKVSVRYIGKLKKSGKIFDSNTGGKPFKFHLGAGQVIKGWDVGVEGMRVGDKRRLTIPPPLGYGSKGAPPQIPPNAWLIFDVELVDVA